MFFIATNSNYKHLHSPKSFLNITEKDACFMQVPINMSNSTFHNMEKKTWLLWLFVMLLQTRSQSLNTLQVSLESSLMCPRVEMSWVEFQKAAAQRGSRPGRGAEVLEQGRCFCSKSPPAVYCFSLAHSDVRKIPNRFTWAFLTGTFQLFFPQCMNTVKL